MLCKNSPVTAESVETPRIPNDRNGRCRESLPDPWETPLQTNARCKFFYRVCTPYPLRTHDTNVSWQRREQRAGDARDTDLGLLAAIRPMWAIITSAEARRQHDNDSPT